MVRPVYSAFHLAAIAATTNLGIMDHVSATPLPELLEPSIPGWTHKGEAGKDCSWVAEAPHSRCPRIHITDDDWVPICNICPMTCEVAGFEIKTCYPLRSVSDVRFNKLPPIEEYTSERNIMSSIDYEDNVHRKLFPLMPRHYPFSTDSHKAHVIRYETKADSFVLPDDFECNKGRGIERKPTINSVDYWLDSDPEALGFDIKPVNPGDDGYWEELEHVVDMQLARINNKPTSSYGKWPKTWNGLKDLTAVAEAVHGEYPAIHQQNLLATLFDEGIEPMTPRFRSRIDFLGYQSRFAAINTWANHVVAPISFMLKWHVGMARPEEMAWLIHRGELTALDDGVPQRLADKIESMDMEVASDFTAYNLESFSPVRPSKGSPNHPSWPAMHATGSTISTWLPAVANLTAEQYCECLRTDYAVSYARTVAGVNYPQDNIAGLNIGRRIIQEELPNYLAENFGYDKSEMKAKLKLLAFDWGKFNPTECTIDGKSAENFLKEVEDAMPTTGRNIRRNSC